MGRSQIEHLFGFLTQRVRVDSAEHAQVLHVQVIIRCFVAERTLLVQVLVVRHLMDRRGTRVHLGLLVHHAAIFGAVEHCRLILRHMRRSGEGHAAVLMLRLM